MVLLDGLEFSQLTFSRLHHNPGNDGALNQGGYGDNLATSPNTCIEFLATPGAHWDTYDGDVDDNGNNSWNVGVAQLQGPVGSLFDCVLQIDGG